MTLVELLIERNIRRALIVDDVYDAVPTANEIGTENEAWSIFSDDLSPEQRAAIDEAYPEGVEKPFGERIADNGYVATLWGMRDMLGAVVEPVFQAYQDAQATDRSYVDKAEERLTNLGLVCTTAGRDFKAAAQNTDLILIDLYFSKGQEPEAMSLSKSRLREAIAGRRADPPLVILMSRSQRLASKREEFRDEVGLLDSGFRIVRKADLEDTDLLERQIERLAENTVDSKKLAHFFVALEQGMAQATARTLVQLRKLSLSDVGQIQQLLLNAEGEPTGSYLVDVFDRVLQHEIEGEAGIIETAGALNDITSVAYPPPYVAGSPDLKNLVERLLTQNVERLRLSGATDSRITFGDILKISAKADPNRIKSSFLAGFEPDDVVLVMTPACDLQRTGAPRVLFLCGGFKPLAASSWRYGKDTRTPSITLKGERGWIDWRLKDIASASHVAIDALLDKGDVEVVARLREAHALELQQRMLTGLGRVGVVAAMPANFPVDVEFYYTDTDGKPTQLDIPVLAEGASCFVGRDADKNPILRLIMPEPSSDAVIEALAELDPNKVAAAAQKAFAHVRGTSDLQRMLVNGLNLKNVGSEKWTELASETGQQHGVPKMGLIAWNYAIPDSAVDAKALNKAGVIILIKDREDADAPGLSEVLMSGLLEKQDTGVAPTEPSVRGVRGTDEAEVAGPIVARSRLGAPNEAKGPAVTDSDRDIAR